MMHAEIPSPEPLDPKRVRRIPRHFAWADHHLRDLLVRLTPEEIALLFFLHLAADRDGCSFWADATLARKLNLPEGVVVEARHGLLAKGFILYRYPLYQILPFSPVCCIEQGTGRRDPSARGHAQAGMSAVPSTAQACLPARPEAGAAGREVSP